LATTSRMFWVRRHRFWCRGCPPNPCRVGRMDRGLRRLPRRPAGPARWLSGRRASSCFEAPTPRNPSSGPMRSREPYRYGVRYRSLRLAHVSHAYVGRRPRRQALTVQQA
jgi:hypothetical protein